MRPRFASLLALGVFFPSLALPSLLAVDALRVSFADAQGNTPLHLAALRNNAPEVEKLLAQGANANARNHAGATALHYATGHERLVATLLEHGADPNVVSKPGITPMMGAVSHRDSFAVVQRLVRAGADVNAHRAFPRGQYADASVLAMAIASGDRRTISLLLEHSASLNPTRGLSPLASAAYNGDIETCRLLIARGADVNAVSVSAGTALNFALLKGHDDVAKLLLENGADPALKSVRGHSTPSMVLTAYNDAGDATLARELVARGADINAGNDLGETALSLALKCGDDTDLVRFLREAGATAPTVPARTKDMPDNVVPVPGSAREAMVREAAQRAVSLLQQSSTAFLENGFVRTQARCVSCHQQNLPAVAFGLARERGLRVDEHALGQQLHAQMANRAMQVERAREMDQPMPSPTVTIGFDADGLHALRYTSDETTDALMSYLLAVQHADGSWAAPLRRPPMEDGPVSGTAWSVRALQLYPPAGREAETATALGRAVDWLEQQRPAAENERVFQLLGLAWAGATAERRRPFVDGVRASQRRDGGWAQLAGIASDAWMTGAALVALHRAGVATDDAGFQRGVEFLLRTQFADGSWWVRSRTWPFQPHFDSQFPHGKDQWISAGGTAWATIALLTTLEPLVSPESLPAGQALIARFAQTLTPASATAEPRMQGVIDEHATMEFTRDIAPIFERSCAGCHTGTKPKGQFSMRSRASLVRGGQSGEPAILPGHAEDSPLIHFATDQVEDLEMPPLDRREKYPALSDEEIERLKLWIDAGVPWPATEQVDEPITAISPEV